MLEAKEKSIMRCNTDYFNWCTYYEYDDVFLSELDGNKNIYKIGYDK